MNIRQKRTLRVFLFSVICALVLCVLNSFLQPAWTTWNNYYTTHGFYEEPENTIETVFLGSSVVVSGITPTELYDEYGICSYNLATEQQPVLTSYYWAQEAYALHKESLKTVVFDVSTVRSDDRRPAFFHKALDPMRLSEIKINAVRDYVDGGLKEILEFIIPLVAYHNRWGELSATDFKKFSLDPVTGTRGYHYIDDILPDKVSFEEIPDKTDYLDTDAPDGKLDKESLSYLIKLTEFCKENNLRLVLLRTVTNKWSSGFHNVIQKFADKHDLEFVDMNYAPYFEKIGYNNLYDTRDGNHLNYFGASKMTKVLGEYLVENCDATDVRNDPRYDHMKHQSELYENLITQKAQLSGAQSITEYLTAAKDGDNTVFITVKDDASSALSDSDRETFAKLGLKELSQLDLQDSYIGIISKGQVVYEARKAAAQTDKSGKTDKSSLEYSGALENGKAYSVVSGGYKNGNTASVTIAKQKQINAGRGINIVVYNHTLDKVNDTATFDTYLTTERERYGFSNGFLLLDKENLNKSYNPYTIEGRTVAYAKSMENIKTMKLLQEKIGENNLFGFLVYYMKNKDNTVMITLADKASTTFTDTDRKNFLKLGFKELSQLGEDESYIALVQNGRVVTEIRKKGEAVFLDEIPGTVISSSSTTSGKKASIKISGSEKIKNNQGLNILVYNQDENVIVAKANFNTHKNAITY